MKKIIAVLLASVLLFALAAPVSAAHVSADEAIAALETLGLVKGGDNGFEPERGMTRAEAIVMLLRLIGKVSEAGAYGQCPYTDGGWAASYIGYAAAHGLTYGVSETQFGSDMPVGVRDYLTMVLRALGYSDADGDFSWAQSIAFADSIGLTHGEYTVATEFLREDMALVSYTALTLKLKDSEQTLARKLYQDGVLSAAALKATRLAGVAADNTETYTAAEIHERGASAVVLMEMYDSREAMTRKEPGGRGSGFFVTADGVLVMTYHELDGYSYARATTPDGHTYDVTGVLHYDVARDIAVVRVSRTDTLGRTVRFFPYIDLGDSDAVTAGETVYTLSNPLGHVDNITAGIISNCMRTVDDPAYPCIQMTAPISQGSSGGVLLNASGLAVGVLYGAFASGQSMNLAIPINCIRSVSLTGSGTPLTQVFETEKSKKDHAVIKAERDRVTLHVGEQQKIMISNDYPGQANMMYEITDPAVVSCDWGVFTTKQSVPLTLTGEAVGETEVKVSFVSGAGNENSAAVIRVVVVE